MKAVAYYRVSTASQGRSGLGLEAQKLAVADLVAQRCMVLLGEFIEVESGKLNARPQLSHALSQAKLTGAVLVIAKLDRLSRNAAFLLALRDSGVRFIAADIPDANDLTIGVLAVIAQAEREAISRRTREALDMVKHRLSDGRSYVSSRSGRNVSHLGNPNGIAAIQRANKGNTAAVAAVREGAEQRARDFRSTMTHLPKGDVTSPSLIARHLNEMGILTARRKTWHPSTVINILRRIGT